MPSVQCDLYPNGEFVAYSVTRRRLKRSAVLPEGTYITRNRLNLITLVSPKLGVLNPPPHLQVGGHFLFGDAKGVVNSYVQRSGAWYVDTTLTTPTRRQFTHRFLFRHLLSGSSPSSSSLVYLPSLSSASTKKSRGTGGLTRRGARTVRNCAFLLDKNYRRQDLAFLTLTLPPYESREEELTIVKNWGHMVSSFLSFMRKSLRSRGIPFEYVAVTEIQPNRLHAKHEYAPHFHLVFAGRNQSRSSQWYFSYLDIRNAWARILSRYYQRPFETSALENLQPVKHSVGRYLSKYLSKGNSLSGRDEGSKAVAGMLTVKCWYSVSRRLLALYKASINRISPGTVAYYFVESLFSRNAPPVPPLLLRYVSRRRIPFSSGDSPGDDGSCRVPGIEIISGCLDYEFRASSPLAYVLQWLEDVKSAC